MYYIKYMPYDMTIFNFAAGEGRERAHVRGCDRVYEKENENSIDK